MRASEFLKMGRIFGKTCGRAGDPSSPKRRTRVQKSGPRGGRKVVPRALAFRAPRAGFSGLRADGRGRLEAKGALRLLPDRAVGVYDARENHMLDKRSRLFLLPLCADGAHGRRKDEYFQVPGIARTHLLLTGEELTPDLLPRVGVEKDVVPVNQLDGLRAVIPDPHFVAVAVARPLRLRRVFRVFGVFDQLRGALAPRHLGLVPRVARLLDSPLVIDAVAHGVVVFGRAADAVVLPAGDALLAPRELHDRHARRPLG